MTTANRAQNAALLHNSIGPTQSKNVVLPTLLFSFSHFLVAGNHIPWLLGRDKGHSWEVTSQ